MRVARLCAVTLLDLKKIGCMCVEEPFRVLQGGTVLVQNTHSQESVFLFAKLTRALRTKQRGLKKLKLKKTTAFLRTSLLRK
jgi:hypothetical protein